MYNLIKKLLFLLPPERAHYFTMNCLNFLFKVPGVKASVAAQLNTKETRLSKTLIGITFPNPVGLAAGFDKNARYIHELKAFGFGFIEIGTVTPKPQSGNPKPRMFRLPKDQALINRLGFNNEGIETAIEKLKKRPKNLIIGGNIGKNKVTPNEQAGDDYLICFEALFPHVDYFVVNVSSPNTPDLRALQDKEPLKKLLQQIQVENNKKPHRKPVLLKIAPDLNESQLDDILDIVQETKIDGIIATNTTISRIGLKTKSSEIEKIGAGGLSGKPLLDKSNEVIRYLRKKNQTLTIIGVGGIVNAQSALEKLNAGADLIQIYTGFIYEGPTLVKKINNAIADSLDQR